LVFEVKRQKRTFARTQQRVHSGGFLLALQGNPTVSGEELKEQKSFPQGRSPALQESSYGAKGCDYRMKEQLLLQLNAAPATSCLKQKVGSCLGCNVLDIVLEKRKFVPREQEQELIERVSVNLCPEPKEIFVPKRSC